MATDDPTQQPVEQAISTGRDQRTTLAGVTLRTPYWVVTGALAIIFLYPLVWTTVASVSPRAAPARQTATASATTRR